VKHGICLSKNVKSVMPLMVLNISVSKKKSLHTIAKVMTSVTGVTKILGGSIIISRNFILYYYFAEKVLRI
jgi:hypothetical protein